jgi:predicted transcriptional regulator
MYLPHMIEDGMVVNDLEQGKSCYHTTPKGAGYLAALNRMCELLQMKTRALET